MKRHVDAGPLVCAHCGESIRDHAASPTGLVHISTGHVRCDGRLMRDAGRFRTTLAVAA